MENLEYRAIANAAGYIRTIGVLIFLFFGSYLVFMFVLPSFAMTAAGGVTFVGAILLFGRQKKEDSSKKVTMDKQEFAYHTSAGVVRLPWESITKVEEKRAGYMIDGTKRIWLEINAPGQQAIQFKGDEFPADAYWCTRAVFANRIPTVTTLKGAVYNVIEIDELVKVGLVFEKWGMIERADEILAKAVDVACARIPGKGIDDLARPSAEAHRSFLLRHGRHADVERLYAKYL